MLTAVVALTAKPIMVVGKLSKLLTLGLPITSLRSMIPYLLPIHTIIISIRLIEMIGSQIAMRRCVQNFHVQLEQIMLFQLIKGPTMLVDKYRFTEIWYTHPHPGLLHVKIMGQQRFPPRHSPLKLTAPLAESSQLVMCQFSLGHVRFVMQPS